MRILFLVVCLLLASLPATAAVINVEFNFTPYFAPADPTAKQVDTIPGKAVVYLNNQVLAEQELEKRDLPVLFEEREISPAVWILASSMGSGLRKGANSIRVEFTPANPSQPYLARFTWSEVTDKETRTDDGAGRSTATNYGGTGKEERPVKGKVVFERGFTADFAVDHAWHHYPPITAVSPADKASLIALLKERATLFKPNFAAAYKLLEKQPNLTVPAMKKAKCLENAYKVGIRVKAPTLEQLETVITNAPELLLQGKAGSPLHPINRAAFKKIKGDENQMCAAMALYTLYPPRLTVVRTPTGTWEVVE
ncbi:hypothetical protein SAMN02745119_00520 [Trichlorobacter thiogenes]|uniref:Uncharacterized protein n=1 Tax=Trichlorobacter thiogenes TaxID=115783 RepID=A0A1T4KF66_9BACT|nr:hypothetical protein [Trichlorobacter thiogenes]SJZ41016.1 hypothetical protein SAMN02745119_00520 [Trichlorobacter thiogenes]